MYETREADPLLPRELFGTAAIVWMFGITVYVGTQVWSALDIGRYGIDVADQTKWLKMTLLSQTGGLTTLLGALAGLVLVALAGPARARVASGLGVAIGFWCAMAGVLGVIVAFHHEDGFAFNSLSGNRFVYGLTGAVSMLLGAVVMVLALRLLSVGGGLTDPVDPAEAVS
jgi:hypothetical protein